MTLKVIDGDKKENTTSTDPLKKPLTKEEMAEERRKHNEKVIRTTIPGRGGRR